jgi:hypothetical protein
MYIIKKIIIIFLKLVIELDFIKFPDKINSTKLFLFFNTFFVSFLLIFSDYIISFC